MNVSFATAAPRSLHTRAIAVGKDASLAHLTAEQRAAATLARFDGEAGGLAEQASSEDGIARRTLVVGTGDGSAADWLKAGSALTARLLSSGDTTLVVEAGEATTGQLMKLLEGAVLRAWRYDRYRTTMPANAQVSLTDIVIVGAPADAPSAWEAVAAVVAGVNFARELVTEPTNIIYPESFVERCLPMAELGIEIEVLDDDAMAAAGMGALLGVGQGSARGSRLLVLRWDGTGGTAAKPVVFVGKGVTFDTGGISIKPAAGMEDMKWDMGGAAAVVGAMMALAGRKAKAHVVGVCGLVENMPSGTATRPGDVVTSMSGQTIEVINTDAEGRMVLADAITWVQRRYAPRTIVDLATLTGAMIVALGHEYGGLFANDDGLAAQLSGAGATVGNPLWRFPLGDAYNKLIDSPIADMKNVGPREAGSITAAQFLQRYVDEGVQWAHLDIAGMVWAAKPGPGFDKGATGYGVRLLDRFIAEHHEG